ncbi:MAG: polysaccharide deacetylase family protein [Candidatus Aminicenantales bacterium]
MKWRHNRAAAASITFDDGYLSQATIGKDLLRTKDLRGTFFLAIASLQWGDGATWDLWRSVAAEGNEIGSHSMNHPYLTELTEEQLRLELGQSQEVINSNIPNQSCLTFCYPYGAYNDFVKKMTAEYYIASRYYEDPDGYNFYPGSAYGLINFYQIRSFSVDYHTIDQLKIYLDTAVQRNAWICIHLHSIADPKIEQRLSEYLDELLKRNIWVDTLGTVVRYMRERIASTIAVLSENDAEITLSLSHALDNSIYHLPLTIRSTVPNSWSKVLITQGSSKYTVTPAIENGERTVYYEAVPNGGVISLLPEKTRLPSKISRDPRKKKQGSE